MVRVIVPIFALLFFLFLMAAILGLLGERISSLPIWKSQIWQTVRIPVMVVSVIAILTILVFFAVHMMNKEAKVEKEFAEFQGWTYTEGRNDPQGLIRALESRLEEVCPKKYFNVESSMLVESGRRSIVLFRCAFKDQEWRHKRRRGLACLIESDRFGPMDSLVDIIALGSLDLFGISDKVDMDDSEFARKFIVTSKNPALAKRVVSESLQAILLEGRMKIDDYYEIIIGPGGAVIITWVYKRPDEYLALVDLAREIESAFK